MFEVSKAEEETNSSWSPPPPQSPNAIAAPPKTPSALRVTLPSELQGVAFIEVHCRKGLFLYFEYLVLGLEHISDDCAFNVSR